MKKLYTKGYNGPNLRNDLVWLKNWKIHTCLKHGEHGEQWSKTPWGADRVNHAEHQRPYWEI